MLNLDHAQVLAALPWSNLVEALRQGFRQGCTSPARHHHALTHAEPEATHLLMPAWTKDYLGMKQANVFPSNAALCLPAISAVYLLSSAKTGQPLALMNGEALTERRTAAASALAADYLARKDAKTLLMVGTGALAPSIIAAHCSVRPSIERVMVWGRNPDKAQAVVDALTHQALAGSPSLEVVTSIAASVPQADVISCATLAAEPLIKGAWLKPGTHLDLIGAFRLDMYETDIEAVIRAQVFIDTPVAIAESGELQNAIAAGAFQASDVQADLEALTKAQHPGRTDDQAITLHKNVGNGLVDLFAAILAYEAVAE